MAQPHEHPDPIRLKQAVSEAIDALNSRDMARFLAFHTANTRVTEPGAHAYTGRDAYRALLEGAVSRSPRLTVQIKRLLVDGATVVMESEVRFDSRSDSPVPEAVVFDFVGDRIASTKVYSTSGFGDASTETSKEHHA